MNAVDELNLLLGIGPPRPQLPLFLQKKGYTFIKVLGKGSFGQAILSWRKKGPSDTKELVVVKHVNLAKMSKKQRRDATNEILFLQKLRHPNIVRYIESCEEREQLYITMEYAEGGDLFTYLQQCNRSSNAYAAVGRNKIDSNDENKYQRLSTSTGRLSEDEILSLFIQIVMAIDYMHDRHLLHRDIKSQNVFLTKDKRIVKLGDFGITIFLQHTLAMASTMCGTPCYFSPEICMGKKYNNKSDVWSLGVLLYEMCCNRLPFEANTMKALMQDICYKNISSHSSNKAKYFPKQYSDALWNLIIAMLSKTPAERPTAKEILNFPIVKAQIPKLIQLLKGEIHSIDSVVCPISISRDLVERQHDKGGVMNPQRLNGRSKPYSPTSPKAAPPPPPPRGRLLAAEKEEDVDRRRMGVPSNAVKKEATEREVAERRAPPMSAGLRAALECYGDDVQHFTPPNASKEPASAIAAPAPAKEQKNDNDTAKPSLKQLLAMYDMQKKKVKDTEGADNTRRKMDEPRHRQPSAAPQPEENSFVTKKAESRFVQQDSNTETDQHAENSPSKKEDSDSVPHDEEEEEQAVLLRTKHDMEEVLQQLTVHMENEQSKSVSEDVHRNQVDSETISASPMFEKEDEEPLDIPRIVKEHEMFLAYFRKNNKKEEVETTDNDRNGERRNNSANTKSETIETPQRTKPSQQKIKKYNRNHNDHPEVSVAQETKNLLSAVDQEPEKLGKESKKVVTPAHRCHCLCGKVQLELDEEDVLYSRNFTCACPVCVRVCNSAVGGKWIHLPNVTDLLGLCKEQNELEKSSSCAQTAGGGAVGAARVLSSPSSPSSNTIKSFSFSNNGGEYCILFCRICGNTIGMKHAHQSGIVLPSYSFLHHQ